MENFVSNLLLILTGLIAIPVAMFFLEIVAATTSGRRERPEHLRDAFRQRIAVLVPAHNEGRGLFPTLNDIKAQLRTGDRLLVVADNCTDDTAAVAVAAGAEVVERYDRERIGKGYALDFGIAHLSTDPPEIIVMIDADCRLGDCAIERLTSTCAKSGRPVQALYLMTAPLNTRINYQIAEFAWRVKNWVRPLGLGALNLPCQLTGSGMAFPWQVIRSAHLANGWLVEDLKLGLDLARAGTSPIFCSSARLTSEFASSAIGAKTQRQRWEQGQIGMILAAPRLISVGIVRRDLGLLALALDLTIPPLSLLVTIVSGILPITGLFALLGFSSLPLMVNLASILGLTFAVLLSWMTYGRDILQADRLFSIAAYALQKLPHYGRILSGKAVTGWIRTDRK